MSKIQTAILTVALAAPFGLAIHEDFIADQPALAAAQPEATLAELLGEDWVESVEEELDNDPAVAPETYLRGLEAQQQAADLSESALRQLFGTERATLGPAFDGLRFGMTSLEVRKSAPDVASWGRHDGELGNVYVALDYQAKADTRLSAVRIELADPGAVAERFLTQTWGEPQVRSTGEGPDIWFDDSTGARAALWVLGDMLTIELSQAMTLDALVGEPGAGKPFGFETGPRLFGAKLDELVAGYDSNTFWVDPYYRQYATLDLPGVSIDPAARPITRLTLTVEQDKVTRVELGIGCGSQCQEVLDAFARKLGDAQGSADAGQTYGTSPRASIRLENQNGTRTAVIRITPR